MDNIYKYIIAKTRRYGLVLFVPILILFLHGFTQADEVTLEWNQITPFAVFHNDLSSTTITIEVKCSGSGVNIFANYFKNWLYGDYEAGIETLQLYDDGINADKIAGDGIYTGEFIFQGPTPTLRLYGGQLDYLRIWLSGQDDSGDPIYFSENQDLELGLINAQNTIIPTLFTDKILFSASAVNIVDDTYYDDLSKQRILQTFYSEFHDDFDGVAIFNAGRSTDIGIPSALPIQNNVTGIGRPISDSSEFYGSQGNLKIFVNMNNNINGSEFLHEFGHLFGVYLNDPTLNLTSSGGRGIHWGTSDIIGQMKGGYYLSRNPDSTFLVTNASVTGIDPGTSDLFHNSFCDLELYLMGLLSAEDISPHYFYKYENTPTFGSTIPESDVNLVTIDDIQQTYGQRSPDSTVSQTDFSFAFIIMSDRLIDTAELTYINTLAKYYASDLPGGNRVEGGLFKIPDPPSFAAATNYIGSLNTSLVSSLINSEDQNGNLSRTAIKGTVTYKGTPVTAMVLANGKYMFTGGGEGHFDLTEVPFDATGKITLYVFCSGLAPYKMFSYTGVDNLEIEIMNDEDGKQLIVTINSISESSIRPGWYDISGTIENESGIPLVAMVLANGQHMFTNNPVGEFNLTVPLDSNDEVTFYGFCSGFSPYKVIGSIDILAQL